MLRKFECKYQESESPENLFLFSFYVFEKFGETGKNDLSLCGLGTQRHDGSLWTRSQAK